MLLRERFRRQKPLEDLEVGLVRASLRHPGALSHRDEAALRWALSLSRVTSLGDLPLEHELQPLREAVLTRLTPAVNKEDTPSLGREARELLPLVLDARAGLLRRHKDRLDPAALDEEVRRKLLVLAVGGGGGTAYAHLGAFALLEEWNLTPSLIAASSMGAVMALFRARKLRMDSGEVVQVLRGLSFRRLFRVLQTESRYGLPAALRLYLRSTVGRHFEAEGGKAATFRDLAIPLLVSVSGVRRGMLPRPLAYYERLIDPRQLALRPWLLRGKLEEVALATAELLARPQILDRIHLGYDEWTLDFDLLDAVGFSSAVPGLIHYDVLRPDTPMHDLLGRLFKERDLARLVDGGITDNVPARAAWRLVQTGRFGSRNALVLALDGFSPKILTPAWLPLQRIAAENVRVSIRYAHVTRRFKRTPSPLEILPSVETTLKAMARGKQELAEDVPLLARLLERLPRLEEIA